MGDWRSKPRNGRAHFLRHLDVIQTMLNAGETQNAIRARLASDAGFDMSASQFSRHIKAFGLKGQTVIPGLTVAPLESITAENSKNESPVETTRPGPKPSLTRSDFRQIRENINNIDLNALVSGKGVVNRT